MDAINAHLRSRAKSAIEPHHFDNATIVVSADLDKDIDKSDGIQGIDESPIETQVSSWKIIWIKNVLQHERVYEGTRERVHERVERQQLLLPI